MISRLFPAYHAALSQGDLICFLFERHFLVHPESFELYIVLRYDGFRFGIDLGNEIRCLLHGFRLQIIELEILYS